MNTTTQTTPKPINLHRIHAAQALAHAGLTLDDCFDSLVPACCKEGCMVEPDGLCEHHCPSVLLAIGLI